VCNYAEDELELTAILMGATVVHAKPDVMRFEVTAPNGSKWIAKVTIEEGKFLVEKD
jgi:outer membrane lipoprotein-sorting protein